MRQSPTDHFIKKKIEVEDPDAEMRLRRGSARRPPTLDVGAENVYLLGLEGSGRKELGSLLAEALGCPFADLTAEPAAAALEAAVAEPGRVVALPPEIVEVADSCGRLQSSGRVFAILADVPYQLERLGLTGRARDEARERLGAQAAALEPLLMGCAHQFFRTDSKMQDLKRSALVFLGREQ